MPLIIQVGIFQRDPHRNFVVVANAGIEVIMSPEQLRDLLIGCGLRVRFGGKQPVQVTVSQGVLVTIFPSGIASAASLPRAIALCQPNKLI